MDGGMELGVGEADGHIIRAISCGTEQDDGVVDNRRDAWSGPSELGP
jgi:hypothetical protein